eukprot:jgi/Hompol1/1308/HPOL_000533-RA
MQTASTTDSQGADGANPLFIQDLTRSESSFKSLPPTRGGRAIMDTGGIRAFVVQGTAGTGSLEHELDELDLKLRICDLTHKEKVFLQDLERILRREDVKDERSRKLRKKQVTMVFRRLHERIVRLVESQSSTAELSKTRREHMQRFLEASKKNLIFLENIADDDPWPEMERQFQTIRKLFPSMQ